MKLGLLKTLVGTVAPTIGTALGGPMGGMAANMISEVLGCDPEPKKIQKAMETATPEQLAQLKKVEADFEVQMKKLDIDLFALETADVQDARTKFGKDWTAKIIGIATLGGFLGYIFLITLMPPEANSEALVNLVLGYLGGLASAIISFTLALRTNKTTNRKNDNIEGIMSIDFSWMDDLLSDDTDYSYLFDDDTDLTPDFSGSTGIGSFDLSSLFGDDDDYSYLFDSDTDLNFDYKPGVDFDVSNLFNDDDDYSYLFDNIIDTTVGDETMSEDDYKGILGLGIGPTLKDFFLGTGDSAGFLGGLLGGGNNKKSGGSSEGVLGMLSGLLGGGGDGILSSDLGKILLARYLSKKDESPAGVVPIGQAAFGAVGQGVGSMPDYRIFNLQPALMPGVGYANAPPPEMKHGGLASMNEGPGDITLARLEPGEFVMTRKATDNIGAKNLYKLMKDAERMS